MATTAPAADRPHQAAKRYIYAWGAGGAEGDATMRDLLGGKGANLAEMTNPGLPVPPGFTITTEACNDYYAAGEQLPDGLMDEVLAALAQRRGSRTGKKLRRSGQTRCSSRVRSGAKFSMPGMMDTVLNLGLNDDDARRASSTLTGNERFAYDAYRRFIMMFGRIVLGSTRRALRPAPRRREGEARRQARHRPRRRRRSRDVVGEFKALVQAGDRRRLPRRPAASSSSWPSAPSSTPGTTSAPSTTARSRRSRTTSAPPSTSRRWSSATWATTPAPASPSRATPPPART